MTDTLPAWLWIPAALLLWGYLAADHIARHTRKDTHMDTIVIAATKAEARARYPRAVAIVTPRSPHAARGIRAHRIVVLESMRNHPNRDDLIEECRPALAFQSSEVTFV